MAGVRVRRKRLMPFVRVALEFAEQPETAPQLGWNNTHAENLIWTYGDAVFLAFAAVAVDHRPKDAGFLQTLCYWVIHGLSRVEDVAIMPDPAASGAPTQNVAKSNGQKKRGACAPRRVWTITT